VTKELESCQQTLIHGDLRLGNLGLADGRVVLIDWGDRTGTAPPAVEVAWFIGFDAHRLDVSGEEVIADFRDLCGERFEERALQLALIAGLVQLGAHFGLGIIYAEGDAERDAATSELAWWTRAVATAFETWSPPLDSSGPSA
jgi:aminoglycoside phosphotransferase (APT) family kinase protein